MEERETGTGGEEPLTYKQVSAWDTEDVVDWMRGLDDCLSGHIQQFKAHCICGIDLLKLGRQQLDYLKVTQIGHQELLLEAIELLSALEVGRAQNSTMSFASGLSKKTSQLITILGPTRRTSADENEDAAVLNRMEITAAVMMSAKTLLNWLDRNPSALVSDYTNFRQELLQYSLELTRILQNNYEPNAMKEACQHILKLTSVMMLPENFATAEPVKLMTVILQPREDTGLGISFQRTRQGSLLISKLTEGSPAADSAILKVGTEIVQINNQNVVAWEISKVVEILKASGHEVCLIVKVGEPSETPNSKTVEVDGGSCDAADRGDLAPSLEPSEGEEPLERAVEDGTTAKDIRRVTKLKKDSAFDVKRSSSSPMTEKEKQALVEMSEAAAAAAAGETSSMSSHDDSTTTTDSSEKYPQLFQERLQQRTSSEGQANRAKKKKKTHSKAPAEYPPVAYRTEIVGGVVVRVPIQKPKGKRSSHGKKDKKPSGDAASDNDSSPDKGKAVFSDAKEVTFGGQTTKQVTVSGQSEVLDGSKANGKKANPALMVPCFQLKHNSYEGWMCKLGGSGLTPKNWRRRWFVLKDKKLYYYKTSFDISALGIVDVVGYTIEASSDMKKKNGFKATRSGARTYCFQVDSPEEMTKWMEVLKEASVPDSQHSLEESTTIEASDDELES